MLSKELNSIEWSSTCILMICSAYVLVIFKEKKVEGPMHFTANQKPVAVAMVDGKYELEPDVFATVSISRSGRSVVCEFKVKTHSNWPT